MAWFDNSYTVQYIPVIQLYELQYDTVHGSDFNCGGSLRGEYE